MNDGHESGCEYHRTGTGDCHCQPATFRFEVIRSKVVPPGIIAIGSAKNTMVIPEPTPPFPGPVPTRGGRWVQKGTVAVDSSQIAINDPVMDGSGVAFMAGLGDGLYEVWTREVEIEPDDWRDVEIRVTLIDDEDVERWINGHG